MGVAVRLHMYAAAISDVAFDKDLSAAHRIAGRVAGVAVNDDLARVHRVSGRLLRVAEQLYLCAVEVCAERVAGDAVDLQDLVDERRSEISLPDHSLDLDDLVVRGGDRGVESFCRLSSCVYLHTHLTSIRPRA